MSARAASASARPLQRPASRRPPRRYSGPARGFPAAGAATAPGLAPAPRRARPASPARRTARVALPQPRSLLSLRLRGRGWIAFVAFALLGIVTMQLVVLRLNTEIGRALQRATALQREDAALAIANSEAGSGESIESLARSLGMVAQAPGDLKFLHATGYGHAEAAARALLGERPSASVTLTSNAGGPTSGFVTPSSGETAVAGATTSTSEPAPQSTQQTQASTQAAPGAQAAPSEGATGEAATTASAPASSGAATQPGAATEPSTAGALGTSATAAGGAQAGAGG